MCEVLVDLMIFVFGCKVDDNVSVLLWFDNGVKGMFWVS